MKKILLFAAVSIAIIVLASFFISQKSQTIVQVPSDWLIYTNNTYGYSIWYPKSWNTLSPVPGIGGSPSTPESKIVSLYSNEKDAIPYFDITISKPGKSEQQFIREERAAFNMDNKLPTVKTENVKSYKMKVNHYIAHVYEGIYNSSPNNTFFNRKYFISVPNKGYSIEFLLGDKSDKSGLMTLEKILNTFSLN